jgi:hypothetical protein
MHLTRFNKMKYFLFLSAFVLTSCGTQLSFKKALQNKSFDHALADTMISYALDHEALYSLIDTLKPISSVKLLRYAIAKDSSMKDGDELVVSQDSLLNKIEVYQKICAAISNGDWQFIVVPFQRTDKKIRNIEIYVVRKSKFENVLKMYSSFFGQWGFTEKSNPAFVLTTIEYETRLDRNRAYGYLFGYPSYAVDFFVESTKIQEADINKKLISRDFFAIPVYAGVKGYFTYATPKGYQPTITDSTIYNKATITLEKYKAVREKYNTPQGLKAMNLWMKMNNQLK